MRHPRSQFIHDPFNMDSNNIINMIIQQLQSQGVPTENPVEEDIINALPEISITDISKIPNEKKNCVVCLSNFELNDKLMILPCTHLFHTNCIKNWFKTNNTCPICKYKLDRNSINMEEGQDQL